MVQLFLVFTLLAHSGALQAASAASALESSASATGTLRRWEDVPERWILLPSEERRYRGLETYEEQASFLAEVWRRRDPDPSDEDNPMRQIFELRVAEANELFSGEGRSGSMTDRGRAYILVGPPSQITQKYVLTPHFSPPTVAGNSRQRSKVLVETWSWRPEDLSLEVRQVLEARHWKIDLTVEFRVSPTRYSLMAGEEFIRLSTRALVRSPER